MNMYMHTYALPESGFRFGDCAANQRSLYCVRLCFLMSATLIVVSELLLV